MHCGCLDAEGSEPEAASTRLPPSTPMKDQSNNDKEPKTKINTSSPLEGNVGYGKQYITDQITGIRNSNNDNDDIIIKEKNRIL